MKTIAFNRSRGSMMTTLLVLGGLAGLYYYTRRGGTIGALFTGLIGSLGKARDFINDVVPSQSQSVVGRANQEVSTDVNELDRAPAM